MPKRFEALDAWRGICACLIVLTHFNEFVTSHIGNSNIVTHAFPLVDFFFVLSGFVIAGSYREKLLAGFSIRKFVALRFGRIYPLHLFMLVGFVALELVRSKMEGTPAFASEYKTLSSLVVNIFMLQSMGILDLNTWNLPSWSISAEFFTYILFAIALVTFRQKLWIPMTVILVGTPLLFMALGRPVMDLSYDLGFIRCIYGFSAGVACHAIYTRYADTVSARLKYATAIEIMIGVAVFAFLHFANQGVISLFAPYLFSICVLVFSLEKGALSNSVLKTKPFILLGALSYSIYMTHYFLERILMNVVAIADKFVGAALIVEKTIGTYDRKMVNVTMWEGDLLCVFIVLFTVGVSYVTYKCVELPANEWFRKRYATKRA